MKIFLRLPGAHVAHLLQAGKIAVETGVGIRYQADQRLAEPRNGGIVGNPEIHPGALGQAFQQAGLDHDFEVARYARLALPENFHQLRNAEFAARAQRQYAQAGMLTRRA